MSAQQNHKSAGQFDYIIVGGGTAGSLLANRLSANPATRVLVLEAGGKDDWIWFHIPIGYLFAIGNPRADWCYSTEPVPGLNDRSIGYARGKVIGGCTAINAMVYMRGQVQDYDTWRQMGLTGWGWDDVLPYFLKHEDHELGKSDLHNSGGEWRVENARVRWPLIDAVAEAGAEIGIPKVQDFNLGNNEGSGYFQVNQRRGRRWSAATGFLKPVLSRPNLELRTNVHVERVALENRRATGIVYSQNGESYQAEARGEVILAAGAINSPQLLQLSGIGPAGLLQQHGIAVQHDLPGVGENLQDHLQLRLIYRVRGVKTINDAGYLGKGLMGLDYMLRRRGALTMAPSTFGMFTRSAPEHATPNVEFHIQPLSLDKFGDPLHPFPAFTASICNLRPTSRGHVRIKSADPRTAPAIQPNYLDTEADMRVAIDSLKLTRRLAATRALSKYQPEEYLPGTQVETEADMRAAAGRIGATIFHPVATAKMGVDGDPLAVLDGRLRVRGIEGLRVIDASAMPLITSGNTASPTLMIAEKGAAMLLQDAR
ncbi:MAG: GMC family oxidoreductase N-terminal domain-containing protein [Ferrovibrio sp.]|uniref:GMC family oxidoreductase n=1 Tax=Ferrovibrio sp. TaxID=1917215 RepID=UPI00262060C8|nr:GMC family oxidoreductase N-terminal domain-containing protein [Ferrovibrio sp.]MCW0232333.1 GMC family oxidoreductase N-terminal domain-containing protein [Ferrovibrio sp.]